MVAAALRALFDLYDYIASNSPEAAGRVVDRIRAAVHLLAGHPMLGRASQMRNRRELIIDQFVVAYQVKRERIWIVLL
jgi:plasmid stabilization system protein ParE